MTVPAAYEPWDYTFALEVLEGLITEGLISYGAFNGNTKKCFETSYSDADQNASLIFTVFFFFFSISKLHNKSKSFPYKLEGREAYIQGA